MMGAVLYLKNNLLIVMVSKNSTLVLYKNLGFLKGRF